VKDIDSASKGAVFVLRERRVRVTEEHEDVPDAELGGEGNRVVEEGEVPSRSVGGRLDVELGLGIRLLVEVRD
jgi:hypothetical protein